MSAAPNFESELRVASTAVQLCAALTKRLQLDSLRADSTAQKSDFSPVTIGDYAVQALLICSLSKAFEGDYFVAEESADELRKNEALRMQVWRLVDSARRDFEGSDFSVPSDIDEMLEAIDAGGKNARTDWPKTWILDPIDGTGSDLQNEVTFLQGKQFAINCALLVDGVQQLALIACPNLPLHTDNMHEDLTDEHGVLLSAVRGSGLWIRPLRNDGILAEPTRVKRGLKESLDQLVLSDCSARTSTIAQIHQDIAKRMACSWPGVDLYSSLMNYAALGLGHADVVLRVFKRAHWTSNVWDHAGGILVYEEAGGKVADLEGREIDLSAGRKMERNRGLVCAPENLHAEVLEVVRGVIEAYGPIP